MVTGAEGDRLSGVPHSHLEAVGRSEAKRLPVATHIKQGRLCATLLPTATMARYDGVMAAPRAGDANSPRHATGSLRRVVPSPA